jgi:hypothetical protein
MNIRTKSIVWVEAPLGPVSRSNAIPSINLNHEAIYPAADVGIDSLFLARWRRLLSVPLRTLWLPSQLPEVLPRNM